MEAITSPKFQNSWPLTVACRIDGAGVVQVTNSYAHVQHARVTQAQIHRLW